MDISPKQLFGSILLVTSAIFVFPQLLIAAEIPSKYEKIGSPSGLYVPVYDESVDKGITRFNNDFNNYWREFDEVMVKNEDSIRNIITGANPKGEAGKICETFSATEDSDGDFGTHPDSDVNPAFAYDTDQNDKLEGDQWGPWKQASEDSGGYIPEKIEEEVKVNTSTSLRCLLQELVEWKKLDLNLQVHALLRKYISDAQAVAVSQQTQNKIAAMNLNSIKKGNTFRNGTADPSTKSLIIQNVTTEENDRVRRELDRLSLLGGADDTNPAGTLNINPEFKDTFVYAVENKSRELSQSVAEQRSDVVRCKLCDTNSPITTTEYSDFLADGNADSGADDGFGMTFSERFVYLVNSGENTLFKASEAMDLALATKEETEKRFEYETQSGIAPLRESSGDDQTDPTNSYEFETTISDPGSEREILNITLENGKDQLQNQKTEYEAPTGSSTEAQLTMNTTGVLGYDPSGLVRNQSETINVLIKEFYDAITYGYFDVTSDTRNWANSAMLMIYDEMPFSDVVPTIDVGPDNYVSSPETGTGYMDDCDPFTTGNPDSCPP